MPDTLSSQQSELGEERRRIAPEEKRGQGEGDDFADQSSEAFLGGLLLLLRCAHDPIMPRRGVSQPHAVPRAFGLLNLLCRCTMSAMAKSGVARLTIGIETKAAMNRPPT